jgi:hypothetical protein
MRRVAILLCLASSARADLAAAPGTSGTVTGFPATDGKRVADRPSHFSGRILVDVIDVESRARTQETFESVSELRRRFTGFVPMPERTLLRWRSYSDSETLSPDARIGAQRVSYEEATGRLALRGPVEWRVDLTLRDSCMGEKRTSAPDHLQVYAARGVVLIEAAAHGGSCLCDDRSMRRVVTATGTFTLP